MSYDNSESDNQEKEILYYTLLECMDVNKEDPKKLDQLRHRVNRMSKESYDNFYRQLGETAFPNNASSILTHQFEDDVDHETEVAGESIVSGPNAELERRNLEAQSGTSKQISEGTSAQCLSSQLGTPPLAAFDSSVSSVDYQTQGDEGSVRRIDEFSALRNTSQGDSSLGFATPSHSAQLGRSMSSNNPASHERKSRVDSLPHSLTSASHLQRPSALDVFSATRSELSSRSLHMHASTIPASSPPLGHQPGHHLQPGAGYMQPQSFSQGFPARSGDIGVSHSPSSLHPSMLHPSHIQLNAQHSPLPNQMMPPNLHSNNPRQIHPILPQKIHHSSQLSPAQAMHSQDPLAMHMAGLSLSPGVSTDAGVQPGRFIKPGMSQAHSSDTGARRPPSWCVVTGHPKGAMPPPVPVEGVLNIIHLLPWPPMLRNFLMNGQLGLTLDPVVREERAGLALPSIVMYVPNVQDHPSASNTIVQGLTYKDMFAGREHLPDEWKMPRDWKNNGREVTLRSLEGVRLVLSYNGFHLLANVNEPLFLCCQSALTVFWNSVTRAQRPGVMRVQSTPPRAYGPSADDDPSALLWEHIRSAAECFKQVVDFKQRQKVAAADSRSGRHWPPSKGGSSGGSGNEPPRGGWLQRLNHEKQKLALTIDWHDRQTPDLAWVSTLLVNGKPVNVSEPCIKKQDARDSAAYSYLASIEVAKMHASR